MLFVVPGIHFFVAFSGCWCVLCFPTCSLSRGSPFTYLSKLGLFGSPLYSAAVAFCFTL